VPNDSAFNGDGGGDSVGLMHRCVGSFGNELNPDPAVLNSGGKGLQGFVWPCEADTAAGIVGPTVQWAVQGAPIQVPRTHGSATMRAGVFDRMESIVQAHEGDSDAPGFDGSAISRGQASGLGHITPRVHGPR